MMMRSKNTIDEDNSYDNVDKANDIDSSSPELASMSASSTSSNMLAELSSSVSISIPY
jgi:hypothetical protein